MFGQALFAASADINTAFAATNNDIGLLFVDPNQNNALFAMEPGGNIIPIQTSGGMNIIGTLAAGSAYPAAQSGDVWFITGAGNIGDPGGEVVEDGDMLVCITDSAGGNQAAAGADFRIEQFNIDLGNIAITGGSINGTPVGDITPAAVTGTGVTAEIAGIITDLISERTPANGIAINNDATFAGDIDGTSTNLQLLTSNGGALVWGDDGGGSDQFGVFSAVANQQATIADPAGGGTVDAESRTAIDAILDLLQAYGLMA